MSDHDHRPRRRKGLALVEVVIGLGLVGAGAAALALAQQRLWLRVEHSRDRAQALQAARSEVERLRTHVVVEPRPGGAQAPDWTTVVTLPARSWTAADGGTLFVIERGIAPLEAGLRALHTQVRWTDRDGAPRELTLDTLLARRDARWGAWLLTPPGGRASTPLLDPGWPPGAERHGTQQVLWRPWAQSPVVWLFDLATGQAQQACQAPLRALARLRSTDLSGCTAVSGWLVAGSIGFATDHDQPDARDAEQPRGPALALALRWSAARAGAATPSADCISDAPESSPPPPWSALAAGGRTRVAYACLLRMPGATADAAWSGRLDLVPQGWALATDASDRDPLHARVCRYSADHDGNGRIDAEEHPAVYLDVHRPLADQHFLVVRASADCPVEPPGQRQGADDSTVPHQPPPA